MIIRFSLENWMSFRDKTEFSMIGTREKQHSNRVPYIPKYRAKVLPACSIYGGNASGKTNFFKALNFLKKMILQGVPPEALIPVHPYILDESYTDKPSKFALEFLVDDTIYELYVSLNKEKILEEKLTKITSTSEKVLYIRSEGQKSFKSEVDRYQKDGFLNFAYKGTKANQLFINNSVGQQIDTFLHVYNWFKNSLQLIAPDSRFGDISRFIDTEDPLHVEMKNILPLLDTGIIKLGSDEVQLDNIPIPQDLKSDIIKHLKKGEGAIVSSDGLFGERIIIYRRGDSIISRKIVSYHKSLHDKDIKFEMRQESDGSKRAIDLLPAFHYLSKVNSKSVFIIDELDRSLHTLLTRQLLTYFLESCSRDSRSQLIFTTHDVMLMDQQNFRRDEMWVTERKTDGSSTLYSFSDFKDVRYDNDIIKSYLTGRLGGVPKILLATTCGTGE